VVAPEADVILVQAKSSQKEDVLAVTRWAVNRNLGDVISMSFISNETCQGRAFLAAQHAVFAAAVARGTTLVAGSGDYGPAQVTCDGTTFTRAVGSPAVDPLVLAVGGTTLDADPVSGAYRSETAWNEPFGATGGGYSTVFPAPAYQRGRVRAPMRAVPDVAWDAALDGGALVYLGGWGIFYGTSAGTPQWAGVVALADQATRRRLGVINDDAYRLAARRTKTPAFHDITTGTNTVNVLNTGGSIGTIDGYPAVPGWDASTGLGSPFVDRLVTALRLS